MRQQFFFGLLILLICCSTAYFGWLVLKAIFNMFSEWKNDHELDNLEMEFDAIRNQRRETELKRLENDCDHDYQDMLGAFPANVCIHCGLARQKPKEGCDHVWRRINGPIPGSRCEKCGASHGVDTAGC